MIYASPWAQELTSSGVVLANTGLVCSHLFCLAMVRFLVDLSKAHAGDVLSFCATRRVAANVDYVHLLTTDPGDVPFHFNGVLPSDKHVFTFIDAVVLKMSPITICSNQDTHVLSYGPPTWDSLHEVIELCCGMGALGFGAKSCGFNPVVGLDENPRILNMWNKLHDCPTICDNVCNPQAAAKVWQVCPRQTCVTSGFSCQPYSELGDKRGQFDSRAQSLPGTLRMAHFVHAQIIILECVKGASVDSWVRDLITSFAVDKGFHVREVVLDLQDAWPSKRSRWWVVLTSALLGPVELLTHDLCRDVVRVSQVIPELCHWHVEDEKRLSLNPSEQVAFQVDGDGCSPHLLNFQGVCACALHSWGSQLDACPCGCRDRPFSSQRLLERGLFGVVTRSAPAVDGSFHVRHLHPSELAGLVGMDPVLIYDEDVKLSLCGLGQLASPIHAAWIFAQVSVKLERLHFGKVSRSPPEQMIALKSWLLARCRLVWPQKEGTQSSQVLEKAVKFWQPAQHLSLHELMNMSYWTQLRTESLSLAYILDVASRGFLQEVVDDAAIAARVDEFVAASEVEIRPFHVHVYSQDADADPALILASPGDVLAELLRAECLIQGADVSLSFAVDAAATRLGPEVSLFPGMQVWIHTVGRQALSMPVAPLLMLEDGCVDDTEVPCASCLVHPDPLSEVDVIAQAVDSETPPVSECFAVTPRLPISPSVHAEPLDGADTVQGPSLGGLGGGFPHHSDALCLPGPSNCIEAMAAKTPVQAKPLVEHPVPSGPSHVPGSKTVHADPRGAPPCSLGPSHVNAAMTSFTASMNPAQLLHPSPAAPIATQIDSPDEDAESFQPMQSRGSKRKPVEGFVPAMTSPLTLLECEALCRLKGPMPTNTSELSTLRDQQILTDDRRKVLSNQGDVWADDEILWHLDLLCQQHAAMWEAKQLPPVFGRLVPVDPLLLNGWTQKRYHDLPDWLAVHFQPGVTLIGAVWIDGHWVPFVVWASNQVLHARTWDVRTANHDILVKFCQQISYQVGLPLDFLCSHRLYIDGHCGAFAPAFLRHMMVNDVLPHFARDIAPIHDVLRLKFEQTLTLHASTVKPWIWGSGQVEQAVQGLKPVLMAQGVPEDLLDQRSRAAVRAIGAAPVLTALQAKVPWRQLKVLANQVRFQFVLPSELEAKIATTAGASAPNRSKGPKKSKKTFDPPKPVDLDPNKMSIVPGTFESQGHVLTQISMHQLGPLAEGIILTKAVEAEPYLRAGKVVSKGPLGVLLIHGPEEKWSTTLDQSVVTVPCQCISNGEPLLVDATLVQLGTSPVRKRVHPVQVPLDTVDVATLKLLVYRDEVDVDWSDFTAAPIKYVQRHFPLLHLCTEDGCSCHAWHNEEKVLTTTAILDCWRRQFLRAGFKPEPASTAAIFTACLRVPHCLLERLLAGSGAGGVYTEPRTPDAKMVDPAYVIVWLPKLDRAELAQQRQMNPSAIGIARVGDRRGLRVLASNAPALHASLRPGSTFLPHGPRMNWLVGPLPFGTDRLSLTKALKSLPWETKVLQPLQTLPGKGTMWAVQSVEEPPVTLIPMSHGDAVITRQRGQEQDAKILTPKPVAANDTLALCGKPKPDPQGPKFSGDPLTVHDPWGTWTGSSKIPAQRSPDVNTSLQQMESKIQEAVLAKIPQVTKGSEDMPARLQTLESQVQGLLTRQQQLEHNVQESSTKHSNEIQQLQHHLQGQVEHQQQSMAAMFEAQMQQIKSILSKRPRSDEDDMNL